MKKPIILTLLLTYACNLKCPFCGQNDIRRNQEFNGSMQLSLEQVEKILDDAVLADIRHVNLWGGEPLLHPRIFDIIKAVKKRHFRCFMVTNGVLLEQYADQILEAKVDFLQLSVDAPGSEHDQVRNYPGLFEKISKGVKKINEKKRIFPIISASAVILPGNITRMGEISDSVFDIGISSMFFQFLMSYEQAVIDAYKERLVKEYDFNLEDIRVVDHFLGDHITDEQFKQGVIEAGKIKEKHGKMVTLPNNLFISEGYDIYMQSAGPIPKNLTEGCWSIDYKVNVQPNGDVVLCPDFSDFIIGNIFENTIEEIWNSQKRQKLVEEFYSGNPLPICYRCCQLWDKEEYGSWKGAK